MKKICTLLFLCTFALYAQRGQLLLHTEKNSSWTGKVERASGELHRKGKGPCFVLYGGYPTALNYKDLIAVSPEKAYILKASFRSLDPKLPASAYLGVDVFDKEKRRIGYCNVQVLYHTDSRVVSAKKGEKFLTIRKFEMKKKIGRFRVAFHTRKDYSDIPNFDLSPICKSLKEDENGNFRIELSQPLQQGYKEGTPVRLHSPWNPGMYYLAPGWVPAGNGEERIVRLQGVNPHAGATGGRNGVFHFWKGTAYVRPFIWFGNWNRLPKKGAKLLVDGFSMEEVSVSQKVPQGKK